VVAYLGGFTPATHSLSGRATRDEIGQILSVGYDLASEYTVGKGGKSVELVGLKRGGISYSENNMGFGEGRVAYLVTDMENAPNGSLFLLEEPEISLHADAQRRLVTYLIEVCYRKGHQVVVTTHSRDILSVAPRDSFDLYRKRGGRRSPIPSGDGQL
jgi:predicted ATPase